MIDNTSRADADRDEFEDVGREGQRPGLASGLVPPGRQSVEADQHADTDQHRAEPVAADLVGDVQRDDTDDRRGERRRGTWRARPASSRRAGENCISWTPRTISAMPINGPADRPRRELRIGARCEPTRRRRRRTRTRSPHPRRCARPGSGRRSTSRSRAWRRRSTKNVPSVTMKLGSLVFSTMKPLKNPMPMATTKEIGMAIQRLSPAPPSSPVSFDEQDRQGSPSHPCWRPTTGRTRRRSSASTPPPP